MRRAASVSPIRTGVGRYLGALSAFGAEDLGALVIRDLMTRTGLGPENDILGNRHRIDQHKMLMHHADAQCDSIVRIPDRHRISVQRDLAAIRRVKTINDLHRRRFPRTILSDQ